MVGIQWARHLRMIFTCLSRNKNRLTTDKQFAADDNDMKVVSESHRTGTMKRFGVVTSVSSEIQVAVITQH